MRRRPEVKPIDKLRRSERLEKESSSRELKIYSQKSDRLVN
jgi:hypothetical protein